MPALTLKNNSVNALAPLALIGLALVLLSALCSQMDINLIVGALTASAVVAMGVATIRREHKVVSRNR